MSAHHLTVRPVAQQPDWPDPGRVAEVAAELAALPPLVFAGECDQLKSGSPP